MSTKVKLFFSRWWTYQRERFPVFAHGLLIAIFASSAMGYTYSVQDQLTAISLPALLVAFINCFLFFLLLRIADEFKDFDDDMRYRSYRPVPRGLVSLKELGWLAVLISLIQLLLTIWISTSILTIYAIALCYFLLMSKEFFVHEWLKKHAIVYLLSHMLIMPLIALYATSFYWLKNETELPMLLGFLLVSFVSGIVLEIGRKIRAPEMEEQGVETYSVLWGADRAAKVWCIVLVCSAFVVLYAASFIESVPVVLFVCLLIVILALINTHSFLKNKTQKTAKRFETLSGLWTLGAYGSLGLLPLVLK